MVKCYSCSVETREYKKIGIPFYKKQNPVCLKCFRNYQNKLNAKAGELK